MISTSSESPHLAIRPEWLALRQEETLWPELRIIDPHHHLWDRPGSRYLLDELNADMNCGHNVVATVFVQSRSMYSQDSEESFRPVGEVEFANGVAACFASGLYGKARGCAGIVAGADLTLGSQLHDVIGKMRQVAGERLKGIRNSTAWHQSPEVRSNPILPPADLLTDPRFITGVRSLQEYGLSLDVWAYHTQLPEVFDLAATCPQVSIIIDHLGGPLGVGPYAGARDDVFREWKKGMHKLAGLPNITVKIGGFGLKVLGYQYFELELPPSSAQLAADWRPYVETLIELFGAARCMFEGNFPVDKGMYSYHAMWNAFKRISQSCSSDEIADLFYGTANRIYHLGSP
ncbi:amidohydrolase [Advenella kashmirensis W13003]|uniref:Amidohydrolase n=1 Tax=Advenella kashmirensis W13003 TaxID=1424334 RepID=V8QPH0_9BURK|nr:amidohydrolase family protein [Advenella kashmirensis]ETF01512.1 amidohydrolase [Advenella kashmirensis W13003]